MIEVTIEAAKGKLMFTDILEGKLDAKYLMTLSIKQEEDIKICVFRVLDDKKKPIGILKSVVTKKINADIIKQAAKEFEIAESLGTSHPNIVKGLALKTQAKTGFQAIEILTEYSGEDILTLSKNDKLTHMDIISIAIQTASAMECAHKKGIFHLNLKPENIFFVNGIAKIDNFYPHIEELGDIKLYSASEKASEITSKYLPPELISKKVSEKLPVTAEDLSEELKKNSPGFCREKMDVFAWGITFYQLLSKETTEDFLIKWKEYRKNIEAYEIFKEAVNNLVIDSAIPNGKYFHEMLSACLAYEPINRPTFEQVKKDWLRHFDFIEKSYLLVLKGEKKGDVKQHIIENSWYKEVKAGVGFIDLRNF